MLVEFWDHWARASVSERASSFQHYELFVSLKLAAYVDRKINKILRNYPERPRHEKHLEEQMLFPHCQKWSDQNKMLLSPPLQHNQEKHTVVAQFCGGWFILGWVTSLYFLFLLRFFCNIKGQFILTRKQTHSPQHPRWLVYCLPQCFFLFELTYLHSHCTIKNKSMKRSLDKYIHCGSLRYWISSLIGLLFLDMLRFCFLPPCHDSFPRLLWNCHSHSHFKEFCAD